MQHPKIIAIYGSPRRKGNTARLLQRAVEGAREAGADVEEIVLRDLKMSPCLEIYGCKNAGECRLKDDFQTARDQILASNGLMLASPVFFYTVSAHTKILMDRFQSMWVKKYWVDGKNKPQATFQRKGLFISVGATSAQPMPPPSMMTWQSTHAHSIQKRSQTSTAPDSERAKSCCSPFQVNPEPPPSPSPSKMPVMTTS